MAQDQKKQWKDRAEYDLFDSANKEQNANTKLQILNNWKQKYPASDFKVDRQETIMTTYQAMGNAKEMLNAAKELVSLDAKNVKGLYWINLLTVSLQDKSPEALDAGDSAAKGLLDAIPVFFDPAKKPATTSDDVWKKSRTDMETIGHRTLGWTAMQRGQNEVAEKEFMTVLQNNPNDAEASLWAGTVIAKQRKLEKQSAALFQIARAAYFDGQGALPPATRTPLQAYLEKTYVNFHGDKDGLDQVIEQAKKSAVPPADFKIESKDEVLAKQFEQTEEVQSAARAVGADQEAAERARRPAVLRERPEGCGDSGRRQGRAEVQGNRGEHGAGEETDHGDRGHLEQGHERSHAEVREAAGRDSGEGDGDRVLRRAVRIHRRSADADLRRVAEDVTGLPKPAPPKRAPVKKATTAKKAAANN